jgi:hypothetical protein
MMYFWFDHSIILFFSCNILKVKIDSYNYKVGDDKLNKLLSEYYSIFYNKFVNQKTLDKINCTNLDNYITKDIKYHLPTPSGVIENNDNYKLTFEFIGQSNIYTNDNPSKTSTTVTLCEKKYISKDKYAYVVLYFPNYDSDGNIQHDYLLSTLLVAYTLKNNYHNYDLFKQSIKGTKAKVICMTTFDVDTNIINILKTYYDEIKLVPYIAHSSCNLPNEIKGDPHKFISITDVSKGHISKNHGYSKVFTKLNIFNKILFPYEKIILLDSDMITMGYFDTLFSLDVPAGYIEHRRLQSLDLGVSSWITDRNQFCKHGKLIPKLLTDIENSYASDINASLLVISPNTKLFDRMISELKTPLNQWFGKYHKGFWLGNQFYDFYLLPEQNYLTKRFSGSWKSIDLGFCSWMLDLEEAFGFTFAGFIVKPWKIQSASHKYSINQASLFSKINNKNSQRAYGYQLLNSLLFSMAFDIKNNFPQHFRMITNELNKMEIVFKKFDPWEPEYKLENHSKHLYEMAENDLIKLSFDQKKLLYICNTKINKEKIQKIIYLDHILDSIARNIYELNFMALSYNLVDIFYDICNRLKLTGKLFPFGNSLVSLYHFGSFDITDDDNDFIMVVKKPDLKQIIVAIITEVLKYDYLQAYICLRDMKFIKITKTKDDADSITLDDFKYNFDINKLKFFNISFKLPILEEFVENKNIRMQKNMFLDIDGNYYTKIPWIDIFFIFDEGNGKLYFDAHETPKYIAYATFFSGSSITEYVTGRKFRIPNMEKYIIEYYDNPNKLKYYLIKSLHNTSKILKSVLFKIDLSNIVEKEILYDVVHYINYNIKNLYAANKF